MSTCFESKTVKARKPHRCRICGQKTAIGETLIARSGADSDGVWRIHMHPECETLSKEWDEDDWETLSPGEIKRPNPMPHE